MATGEAFGEGGGQQPRGGAREDRVGRRHGVEPGENVALHLEPLRRVLLDVDRAVERLLQAAGLADPGEDGLGRLTVQEVVRGEVAEDAGDIAAGDARGRRILVPER